MYYLKFDFWIDVISSLPFFDLNRNYLWIRFLKTIHFRDYQKFLVDSLNEIF